MQLATDFDSAIVRKYPEGIGIAIAQDDQGKHNPITLTWLTRVSAEPPMFAIAIAQTRHSLAALRHSRAFVVSLPSAAMKTDAVFFGTVSGRDLDKLAQHGTSTQPAAAIDSVLLADAVANFECVLEHECAAGDHVIFVGRVVAAHMNADPNVRGLYALGDYQFGGVVPG